MTAVRPGRWKVGWRTVGWNSAFCLPRCTRIPHWRTNLASTKQGIIRCRIVPEGAAGRPHRGLGFRPKGRSRNVSDPGRGPVALPPRSSAAMAGPRRRIEDRLASRTRSLAVLLRWLRARGWSMGSSSARGDHPAPVRKSFSLAIPRPCHRPRTDIRATPATLVTDQRSVTVASGTKGDPRARWSAPPGQLDRPPRPPAGGRGPEEDATPPGKGTTPRYHRPGEGLGRSRAGLACTIHLAGEGDCRPPAFPATPDQWGDAPQMIEVLERNRVPARRAVGPPASTARSTSAATRSSARSTASRASGPSPSATTRGPTSPRPCSPHLEDWPPPIHRAGHRPAGRRAAGSRPAIRPAQTPFPQTSTARTAPDPPPCAWGKGGPVTRL